MVKEEARAIGKAIARRRSIAGLTQEEVAERLGVGQEAVSRMERGVASLTVARLAALAEIFQCNIAQLITESSDREDDQALALSSVLERLAHHDRTLLIEWLNVFAARFEQARSGEASGHANVFSEPEATPASEPEPEPESAHATRRKSANRKRETDEDNLPDGARRRSKPSELIQSDGGSSD